MEEELQQYTASDYASMIRSIWDEIVRIRVRHTASYLQRNTDQELRNTYVGLICALWLELSPQIKTICESENVPDDFEEQFISYKKYVFNPRLLVLKEADEDFRKMEECLRRALEYLGYTQIK